MLNILRKFYKSLEKIIYNGQMKNSPKNGKQNIENNTQNLSLYKSKDLEIKDIKISKINIKE